MKTKMDGSFNFFKMNSKRKAMKAGEGSECSCEMDGCVDVRWCGENNECTISSLVVFWSTKE